MVAPFLQSNAVNQLRWINTVSSALLLVGMTTAWIIFAPMQFGGQVAYVIVNGNSMEPLYQQGDLVIVHRAAEYQLGDIITYRHPDIGPVIHRIIGLQGDNYLLKGDHNSWTDSFLPSKANIVGKAWIHIPAVGKVFGYLRNPWILSILAASIGAVFLFTVLPTPSVISRHRGRRFRKVQQPFMKTVSEKMDNWLFVLVVTALAALGLGLAAFTHPVTRIVIKDIHYTQEGVYNYSSPQGGHHNIYDPNGLKAGDPVFRQLINKVNIQFDYKIVSDNPIVAQGTGRLIAELSAVDGWRQNIELQADTTFRGSSTSVSGTIDLDKIQAILDNLQNQTGIQRQSYTILVTPQISVQGQIGNQAFVDEFSPKLQFQIDPFEMQLFQLDPSGPNPLSPTKDGLLKWPVPEPNKLSFLGLQLEVLAMRWVSVVVFVLSLGGLIGLGIPAYRVIRAEGETTRIQRKYGTNLINISKGLPGRNERVKEVGSIDELAKLADKDGRPILHMIKGQNHIFFVQDTTVVYRYTVAEKEKELSA